jgi:hypothetical protein
MIIHVMDMLSAHSGDGRHRFVQRLRWLTPRMLSDGEAALTTESLLSSARLHRYVAIAHEWKIQLDRRSAPGVS